MLKETPSVQKCLFLVAGDCVMHIGSLTLEITNGK